MHPSIKHPSRGYSVRSFSKFKNSKPAYFQEALSPSIAFNKNQTQISGEWSA